MIEEKPLRRANGTLEKGQTLNRGGRPKGARRTYRTRTDFHEAVLSIAERTSTKISSAEMTRMSFLERELFFLAATKTESAAKTFVEYVRQASLGSENDIVRKLRAQLGAAESQVENLQLLRREDQKTSWKEIRLLKDALSDKEGLLKRANQLIDAKADRALE
jgi:hypothetical protein